MQSLVLLLVSFAALFALCTAADDPTPIQHRIALEQPHGMTLSWSTLGPIGVTPTIAIGRHPDHLDRSVKGWTQHYDPSITWFHHVVVEQLEPSTRYYWTVTSPANLSSSPVLNFTTAPRAGDPAPFVVSINGDMGLVNEDDTLVTMKRWAADGSIDLFWHVGDMSYADDWRELNMTYEQAMELWMHRMRGIWTSTAYMMCPGNHEATCDEGTPEVCPDGQRNFTSYRERFRMPARESGAVNNMWFSFDYGLVHFISIDTEVDYPKSPEGRGTWGDAGPFGDQLGWLAADLKKANANRAHVPWILVSGHRPYYASDASGLWPDSRQSFEPLFIEYTVDIVFWGHVHFYERMYPTGPNGTVVQKDYTDAAAPIYIISGAPGNVEGLSKTSNRQACTAFLDDDHFGLGLLTVHNATHLDWDFYASKDQEHIDHVTIIKEKRWKELTQQQTNHDDELTANTQ